MSKKIIAQIEKSGVSKQSAEKIAGAIKKKKSKDK